LNVDLDEETKKRHRLGSSIAATAAFSDDARVPFAQEIVFNRAGVALVFAALVVGPISPISPLETASCTNCETGESDPEKFRPSTSVLPFCTILQDIKWPGSRLHFLYVLSLEREEYLL
jgi:hypothetical protein